MKDGWLKMNARMNTEANAQLAKDGMRLASIADGESGWYTLVMIDGEAIKVWATEIKEEVSE
jgi:hypothetical protein